MGTGGWWCVWFIALLFVGCTGASTDTDVESDTDPDTDSDTLIDEGTDDVGTDTEWDTSTPAPVGGLARSADGESVVIGEPWRACETPDDCVSAGTSCNGCCAQGAIDADLAHAWRAARDAACADYEGPECDCDFQCGSVDCVDSLCVWQPTPDVTECAFGPDVR